ncbi:SDR family oxidoreductase [Zavarzinia aquatilis]|uniref:Short-chain dehydrogenase/reductase n=1 Tax=Zavarzinia aquatilis TaxID=2211142 RepID=A0A317EL14_9PROT|nr:SDR family oxidoreductase [Zavarzinia aquatilis]PWR25895.1 short-chain dehydrogenase/reductase [Zavarzinia aquatilis]
MGTVLITGCSTGFGRETALHFLNQGWTVVATMRNPAASTLPPSERLRVLPLDVTDPDSIAAAVAMAGPVDVLVNNAGIGWFNALEGTSLGAARRIFETNLFGAIAMMQAVLPGMRERASGAIVNVGSSVIYMPLPMLSVYRASKAALTALTESMALELAPLGIRARVVAPGMAPDTAFAATTTNELAVGAGIPEAYADQAQQMFAQFEAAGSGEITTARDVAEAVFRAATEADCPAVLPAGPDAIAWSQQH